MRPSQYQGCLSLGNFEIASSGQSTRNVSVHLASTSEHASCPNHFECTMRACDSNCAAKEHTLHLLLTSSSSPAHDYDKSHVLSHHLPRSEERRVGKQAVSRCQSHL